MAGQCRCRNPGSSWTVMPSTPGLPLLALTRFNARLQFSCSQTPSINGSPRAELSVLHFAASDSVPPPDTLGASLLLSSAKASTSWFFCRLSLMSCAAYSPLPLTPCGDRSGLHPDAPGLLCPLLTSAARSGSISRPSVPIPGQTADLPR